MASKKVWVRDPAKADDEVFARGTIISEDATQITVQLDGGATQAWPKAAILEVCRPTSPLFPVHARPR